MTSDRHISTLICNESQIHNKESALGDIQGFPFCELKGCVRVVWSLMLSYVRFLKVSPTIFVGEMTELAIEMVSFLSYLLMQMECQMGSKTEASDDVLMS